MALYVCEAIDAFGKKVSFNREATDEVSLRANLKRENLFLIKAKIYKEKEPNLFFAVSSKVKMNEVISFLRQFSVMIKAGISISDSLNSLRSQKHSKPFQKVLLQVYQDIQSGVLLSEAFAKFPKVFPNFFVNMIGIGEVSGSLDQVLESLADYYENDRKIKRKAKTAMVYPIILLVLIVVVTLFLALYVLPQFEGTINELGGDVPTLTRVVMGISEFIKMYFIFIIAGIFIVFLIAYLFFKKTKKGRYALDWLKFHLPFIGRIEKNLITSRFSKAFIILLNSGMTITDCLENLRRMLGNAVFSEKFKYTIDEVKRGKRIALAIENTKLFPLMLTEMINVGEKSGNIEEVLEATSNYFDEQVESSIQKATAALEPIMIIFLGGIVAVVILSVLLPIISLMQSI